jgi:RHS repeat-associated protein
MGIDTGSTLTVNLRFPGQYYDSETGLNQNGFRDYNPALGRYVQADPIGLYGGVNLYGYVNSNPLMYIDSKGLYALVLGGVWGSGAAAAGGTGAAGATITVVGGVAAAGIGGYIVGSLIYPYIEPYLSSVVDWAFNPSPDPMQMTAPGNVAHTAIVLAYGAAVSNAKLCGGRPPDRCDWLKENVGNFSPAQVKAAEKAWGCRGSRAGR